MHRQHKRKKNRRKTQAKVGMKIEWSHIQNLLPK